MNDNERITLLEERYAHLQRHNAEQDKAMLELAEEVAKLRKELAALRAQQVGFERVAPYKVSRHRNSLPEIHEIGRVEVMHCGAATEDGQPVQGQAISTPPETSANPPACSPAGHTPESC